MRSALVSILLVAVAAAVVIAQPLNPRGGVGSGSGGGVAGTGSAGWLPIWKTSGSQGVPTAAEQIHVGGPMIQDLTLNTSYAFGEVVVWPQGTATMPVCTPSATAITCATVVSATKYTYQCMGH